MGEIFTDNISSKDIVKSVRSALWRFRGAGENFKKNKTDSSAINSFWIGGIVVRERLDDAIAIGIDIDIDPASQNYIDLFHAAFGEVFKFYCSLPKLKNDDVSAAKSSRNYNAFKNSVFRLKKAYGAYNSIANSDPKIKNSLCKCGANLFKKICHGKGYRMAYENAEALYDWFNIFPEQAKIIMNYPSRKRNKETVNKSNIIAGLKRNYIALTQIPGYDEEDYDEPKFKKVEERFIKYGKIVYELFEQGHGPYASDETIEALKFWESNYRKDITDILINDNTETLNEISTDIEMPNETSTDVFEALRIDYEIYYSINVTDRHLYSEKQRKQDEKKFLERAKSAGTIAAKSKSVPPDVQQILDFAEQVKSALENGQDIELSDNI